MSDKIKIALALIIVGSGVVGFYAFPDQSVLLRVIGLLVLLGLATFIYTKSVVGGETVAYIRGATIEIRKVVWPTRKETINTTLLVSAMVVLIGLILWLFDVFLVWAVKLLSGQGA